MNRYLYRSGALIIICIIFILIKSKETENVNCFICAFVLTWAIEPLFFDSKKPNKMKHLKPSTRCIDNLGDTTFTKTGMNPAEHAAWEKDTADRIKEMHDKIDFNDNPPEQMTKAEIDLWIQQNTIS